MPVTSWRRSTCADSGSHCGSAGGWPLPHHDDLGMPRRCCINEARFLGRADRRDVLLLHVRVNSGVPARRTRFPISGATDAASLTGSGAFDHIAFRAKESDVLIARLKEQGYPFRERQVPDMDLFQVFVDDPNGITVELNYWAEDQKAA